VRYEDIYARIVSIGALVALGVHTLLDWAKCRRLLPPRKGKR